MAELIVVTLRAAARQVGTTRLTRGQSLTFPPSADVSKFRAEPKVWDVKRVQAPELARRRPARAPEAETGPVVSGKASAAFKGLVNRLEANAEIPGALEGQDLAGFRAMVYANAGHLAGFLARCFGGDRLEWAASLQDLNGAEARRGRGLERLAQVLEAGTGAPASTWLRFLEDGEALERAAEVLDELEAVDEIAAETEAAPAAPSSSPAPSSSSAAPDPDDWADGLTAEDLAELDADADGEPFEPPAAAPSSSPPPVAAEAPPAAPAPAPAAPAPAPATDARVKLGELLVAFQGGAEAVTMRQVLDQAKAAGLEVPPELHRVRRRDELAAAVAKLLAAPPTTNHPAPPAPGDLES